MPDYSLDIAVATAVEPMPPPIDADVEYVATSPMQMWIWESTRAEWYAGTVQDSIQAAMRAYELFFNRTGWRLIQLRHSRLEEWSALLFMEERPLIAGEGTTAAIAICEAIKAASLADQNSKGDSLQGEGSKVRSSESESA
jgi:hypothetical protein